MFVPQDVKFIITTLQNEGYFALIVGGALRDYYLKRPIYDYDIATSASPDEVMKVFKNYKVIPTGIKYGTVLIILNNTSYEVTTFRTEQHYLDHRHPSKVEFVENLYEDLARRDFTINAMAYTFSLNHEEEKFFDYFGGLKDLEEKKIRTVGAAKIRFNEDALRIMRALRFASQLEFKIVKETKEAIKSSYHLLKNVAWERISVEFRKIIEANFIWTVKEYFEVYQFLFPSMTIAHVQEYEKYYKLIPQNYIFYLALLFLDNPQYQTEIDKLHLNKFDKGFVTKVISSYPLVKKEDAKAMLLYLQDIHLDCFAYIIQLKDLKSEFLNSQTTLNEVLKAPYKLSSLKISGRDLIKNGFPEGENIKKILIEILILVNTNQLANSRKVLIDYIKNKRGSL